MSPKRGGVGSVIYIESDNAVSREMPAWMCDRATCAELTKGKAQVSIAALVELRTFLSTIAASEEVLSNSPVEVRVDEINNAEVVATDIDVRRHARQRRGGTCGGSNSRAGSSAGGSASRGAGSGTKRRRKRR
jgi:hypothetical protein